MCTKEYAEEFFELEKFEDVKNNLLENISEPARIKDIVADLLIGGNYRTWTEVYTKIEISLYNYWILYLIAKAKKEFGDNWFDEL